MYQEKENFVRDYLKPLLKRINNDILSVQYIVDKNKEEYVIITYNLVFPSGNQMFSKICVTADSLQAIVEDTIRRI